MVATGGSQMELTGLMAEKRVVRLPPEPQSSVTFHEGSGGPSRSEMREEMREFDSRVVRAAVLVCLVVVGTVVILVLLWRLRALLLLMIVSLFAAAVLHPVVRFVQRLGLRRKDPRVFGRGVSTLVVFGAAFIAVVGVLAALVGPVVTEATHFVVSLPQLVREAQHGKGQIGHLVVRFHLLKFVESKQGNLETAIHDLSRPALEIGKSVVSGLVSIATITFLSFFCLLEAPRMVRGVLAWVQPHRSERIRHVLQDVGRAVMGYMLGNLLTSLIAGVVVGVALFIMGVSYVEVLAIWVALVDFLPMIGGLLAGVPTVIVAALHSLPAGLVMLIVFLVYQELENHVLSPLVMSRTVRLNPLWVLLAVLIGAELGDLVGSVFGALVGALIAVPGAGAVQVIGKDLWQHRTGAVLFDLGFEDDVTGEADEP
jgi:predicted PurR-regulated permease PerM